MGTEYQYDVSVVVPVYNAMEYLEECINSLISQSLSSIEIICVDDGSTDSTLEYLFELQKKHNNIVIVTKPNKGYGHSMNVGMSIAQGEYIGIVESDDYVDSEMFKELYEIAKEKNLDFVKSDFTRFYRNYGIETSEDNLICKKNPEWYGKIWNPSKQPELLDVSMNTWTGIYRNDFLKKYNIVHNETPGASYQDNGFWFQTFFFGSRAMFINKVYYHLRRDNPNSSIYNRGKIYAMCDEYAYILSILKKNPKKYEDFIGMYHKRKYYNYIFNLNRVAPEFKHEFAKRFAEEYIDAIKKKELDQSLFSEKEYRDIEELITDPDKYVDAHYRNVEVDNFNGKVVAELIEKDKKHAKEYCMEHSNSPLANAWLARIYRDGIGVEPDYDKSITLYSSAAKLGVKWAPAELIDLLLRRNKPDDRKQAFDTAKEYASESREMGGVCGRLGRMYRDGIGTTRDFDQAVLWLKKASDLGVSWAHGEYVTALLKKGDEDSCKQAIKIAMKKIDGTKNTASLYGILGRAYRDGNYVPKDIHLSIQYYETAVKYNVRWAYAELVDQLLLRIKQDTALAFSTCIDNATDAQDMGGLCGRLGRLYRDGVGTKVDLDKARKYLTMAAKQGVSWANDELASLAKKRDKNIKEDNYIIEYPDFEKNLTTNYELLESNLLSNDSESVINLIKLVALGEYNPKNTNKLVEDLAKQIDSGIVDEGKLIDCLWTIHGDVSFELIQELGKKLSPGKHITFAYIGRMYYHGLKVLRNPISAFEWYYKSLSLIEPTWIYDECLDVLLQIGDPKYFVKFVEYLDSLGEINDPELYTSLGKIYKDGKYISADYGKSKHYLNIARKYNFQKATNEYMILLQKCGTESEKELFDLASEEALKGNGIAMNILAEYHRKGILVEKDLYKSANYYRDSIQRGIKWSINGLFDTLWEINTPDSLSEMISIIVPYAISGDGGAMGRLARAYHEGKGVKRDLNQARLWMLAASEKNIDWAKLELKTIQNEIIEEGL